MQSESNTRDWKANPNNVGSGCVGGPYHNDLFWGWVQVRNRHPQAQYIFIPGPLLLSLENSPLSLSDWFCQKDEDSQVVFRLDKY